MYFQISKYLGAIYRKSKIEINQQIQDLGVRATQGDLILFINDNPGLTQKQISKMMVLDASLVGRDIQKLIDNAYVIRHSTVQGYRTNSIFLTDKGVKLAHTLQAIIESWWYNCLSQDKSIDESALSVQLANLYHNVIDLNP